MESVSPPYAKHGEVIWRRLLGWAEPRLSRRAEWTLRRADSQGSSVTVKLEASPMITIHHLGISQSDRIVWLCEELGLPYELVRYERDRVTRLAPPEYRALHPFGAAPVITDGDLVLGESGAIIEYIIGRYGGGRLAYGPEHPEFAAYLFWLHFANGSMMPAAMTAMVGSHVDPEGKSDLIRALSARSDRAFDLVEARLGEVPYFAGEAFTAADIIMMFPLTTMRMFAPRDISGLPNTLAYLARVTQRPAYRRAMAKADPGLPPKIS